MSEEWNQDPRNSNWTDANTVRRLTETEVNSSTYQEQVRDRGVPQSYPDEWLELRWIRPGQTSLIPLQCRRREKKEKGEVLHTHGSVPRLFPCHSSLSTSLENRVTGWCWISDSWKFEIRILDFLGFWLVLCISIAEIWILYLPISSMKLYHGLRRGEIQIASLLCLCSARLGFDLRLCFERRPAF